GIVEDEGIVALDISGIISNLGYETAFITDSAEKALLKIIEDAPDVVLMDIELKGDMNGLQAAKKIKEIHNIPVIFLTAFEDENTISRINEVNNEGYIVKPFEDAMLKEALVKVLR
ncbi:MAG TPA: response regulator, partial [Ignavibacteria bacterium]